MKGSRIGVREMRSIFILETTDVEDWVDEPDPSLAWLQI